MPDTPRPDITVQGHDGSVFRYFAIRGRDFSPSQVGWVLLVTSLEPPIDPQAISVREAIDDLESMVAGDRSPREAVQFFTELMIEDLESRANDVPPEQAAPYRVRADELQAQLSDALA